MKRLTLVGTHEGSIKSIHELSNQRPYKVQRPHRIQINNQTKVVSTKDQSSRRADPISPISLIKIPIFDSNRVYVNSMPAKTADNSNKHRVALKQFAMENINKIQQRVSELHT